MRIGVIYGGVFACLIAVFPSIAQELPTLPEVDQVPVTMSVEFYDVDGRSYRSAVRRMREVGPSGYDAVTQTYLNSYFELEYRDGQCAVSFAEVPLEIVILYPNWTRYERSGRSDRANWDTHMDVLTVHENIHAVIAFLGAIETYNSIVRANDPGDCQTLQDRLRSVTRAANEQIQRWQREYDDLTDHGREQHVFDLDAFMEERL